MTTSKLRKSKKNLKKRLKMHSPKKTLRLGLSAFLICLTVSCSSCKDEFNWSPTPYVGDSDNQQIVREDGSTLRCDEPRFNKIVCLDEDDVSSLVAEIRRINKKAGKKAVKELQRVKRLQKKVEEKSL